MSACILTFIFHWSLRGWDKPKAHGKSSCALLFLQKLQNSHLLGGSVGMLMNVDFMGNRTDIHK